MTFAQSLWKYRDQLAWPQSQAAKFLDITRQTYIQFETGKQIPTKIQQVGINLLLQQAIEATGTKTIDPNSDNRRARVRGGYKGGRSSRCFAQGITAANGDRRFRRNKTEKK